MLICLSASSFVSISCLCIYFYICLIVIVCQTVCLSSCVSIFGYLLRPKRHLYNLMASDFPTYQRLFCFHVYFYRRVYRLIHTTTHSPTYSFIHSPIQKRALSIAHPPIDSLTHLPPHPPIHSLGRRIHPNTRPLTHSLARSCPTAFLIIRHQSNCSITQ